MEVWNNDPTRGLRKSVQRWESGEKCDRRTRLDWVPEMVEMGRIASIAMISLRVNLG